MQLRNTTPHDLLRLSPTCPKRPEVRMAGDMRRRGSAAAWQHSSMAGLQDTTTTASIVLSATASSWLRHVCEPLTSRNVLAEFGARLADFGQTCLGPAGLPPRPRVAGSLHLLRNISPLPSSRYGAQRLSLEKDASGKETAKLGWKRAGAFNGGMVGGPPDQPAPL